jgi:type III secretion system FlhB-like substrate exporter
MEKSFELDRENHKDHKNFMLNADILEGLEEHEKADRFYKKAIEMCIQVNGNEHMETASVYNNYGLFLYLNGKHTLAKKYLTKAYKLMKNYYGEEHLYTIRCLGHIAKILFIEKKYQEAYKKMQRALQFIKKILGNNNKETLIIKNNCKYILSYEYKIVEDIKKLVVLIVSRNKLAIGLGFEKKYIAPKITIREEGEIKTIINLCKENNIPVKYNKKLAEYIFNNSDKDEYVPEETYQKIANILSKIMKMHKNILEKE